MNTTTSSEPCVDDAHTQYAAVMLDMCRSRMTCGAARYHAYLAIGARSAAAKESDNTARGLGIGSPGKESGGSWPSGR